MNNEQEKALIRHMNDYPEDSMEMHAEWASWWFGVTVDEETCRNLFFSSLV